MPYILENSEPFVQVPVSDVQKCDFKQWYENFKDDTIKSIILPLPDDVVQYLKDPGPLVLPEGSQIFTNNFEADAENETTDEEWSDEESLELKAPNFDDFNKVIDDAIALLGGNVFPKLNWSSPKDATWIPLDIPLQCKNFSEVFLLLKSSDLLSHDLFHPFTGCEGEKDFSCVNYCLVLKNWTEINSSSEFRCFVKNSNLIGISQRDASQFYSCITAQEKQVIKAITLFWKRKIKRKFSLSSYFSPFCKRTNSILFSWEELMETIEHIDADADPEFRYIIEPTGIQPSPLKKHSLPKDIVDIATGEDPLKFIDFLNLRIQEEKDDSEDL